MPHIVSSLPNSSKAVDSFIGKLNPDIQSLAELLRTIILTSSGHIKEEIKHGIPFYKHKGHLCYINPFDDKVILGFSRGAELPDEHNMLIGTGKSVRHAVFRNDTIIDEDKIRHLIYEALIINEMKAGSAKRN